MSVNSAITRRKVLSIFAGAGMGALGLESVHAKVPTLEWRGRALGGRVRMLIRHRHESEARNVLSHCLGEIERLERIFSLYRKNSEIATLNREGRLNRASQDLRVLLGEAQRSGHLSNGLFDVTIQPLWELYSTYFASRHEASTGPGLREIDDTRRLVNYREIDLDNGSVRLARPGMGLTLNGIAQGYITDRIADILKNAGMTDVLIDLGEIRTLDGANWNVGVANPKGDGQTIRHFSVRGAAAATSSGGGSRFEPTGRYHHILDPRTGDSPTDCLSATAIAATATTADALATTLALSPLHRVRPLLRAFGGQRAIMVMADGRVTDITA